MNFFGSEFDEMRKAVRENRENLDKPSPHLFNDTDHVQNWQVLQNSKSWGATT